MFLIEKDMTIGGLLLVPAWLVQSIGYVGFSNAAHECVHGHFLGMRRADRWAGRFLHLPLLLNYEAHRIYHLRHHAYTRMPNDPEGEFDYKDIPNVASYLKQVVRWLLPPSPLHILNQQIVVAEVRSADQRRRRHLLTNEAMLVAYVVLIVWFTVTVGLSLAAQMLLVPLLIAFPVVAFFTSLPEHFGLSESVSPFEHTRTILVPAWFSWLLWHFNYHTAHHAKPNVPFSRLQEVHAEFSSSMLHVCRGYLRYHLQVLRTVRAAQPPRRG
jgi:fatty acid desaturase